jgi:nitroreductase
VNSQTWQFVVVIDEALRAGLAELYRRAWQDYSEHPLETGDPDESRGQASSRYLAQHLHEVPVHVIPCIQGRPEGQPASELAAMYGSIVQASWSFQLAARAHGLGSVFTTYHLDYEREAAELLGIPYDEITQVALLPTAYTLGTDFRPAQRKPMDDVVHWDRW